MFKESWSLSLRVDLFEREAHVYALRMLMLMLMLSFPAHN